MLVCWTPGVRTIEESLVCMLAACFWQVDAVWLSLKCPPLLGYRVTELLRTGLPAALPGPVDTSMALPWCTDPLEPVGLIRGFLSSLRAPGRSDHTRLALVLGSGAMALLLW